MATIQQLLNEKGHEVLKVGPDDTVLAAIEKMAANNVGSLVVLKDRKFNGRSLLNGTTRGMCF